MKIATPKLIAQRGHALLAVGCVAAAACSDATIVQPNESRVPSATARMVVSRVNAPLHDGGAANAVMGEPLRNATHVRVTNESGVAQSGLIVNFSIARGTASLVKRVDTTDAAGIADAGDLTLAVVDTAIASAQIRVTVGPLETSLDQFSFSVTAQRDLEHFGGASAAVFNAMPIDQGALADILPLGTMSTADHALPSADALLVPRGWPIGDRRGQVQVRAMSNALIIARDDNGTITLRVRDQVTVRYAALVLRRDLWVGRTVAAGELLGEANALSPLQGIPIRVLDAAVQHRDWISPSRYGELRNTAFFVQYLSDSLRSNAYAIVRRFAPDLGGRIDYDRAGRAVGSWFDDHAPIATSMSDPSAELAQYAITLAYDAEHPGQVRVAIGKALFARLGVQGVFAVAWDDADPATISADDGVVTYRLYPTDDGARIGRPIGTLVLQLNGNAMQVGFARDGDIPRLTSAAVALSR